MKRTLPVCALLLTLPLTGRADEPAPTVIRMKVQAMPAPKPALKYQLLPELREMNPGNPAQGYLKCFMEQNHFYFNKRMAENREKWLTMPLKDLPLLELREYSTNVGLRQADYAARLDTPDWEVLLKLKSDGINLLLPDVQRMRALAGALKLRFRYEIAERRFDDALITAKTLFALSRHLGEHPTLIGDLVGIAIATATAIEPLEEMIQRPGCPNFFWALTDLPHPFIDLRKGLQGERVWMLRELDGLDERAPMTDGQMRTIVDKLRQMMQNVQGPGAAPGDVGDRLDARVKNEAHLRAARKRLIESGAAADRIEKFPPLQVVLLDEKLAYEVRRDEETKALALPYWQASRVLAAIPPPKKDEQPPLTDFVASFGKVKMAQARLDQRLGLLRCVEALRLHAAEHDGRLPAKLADIKLPLPVDPATGKPFTYKLEGRTAHLQGARLIYQVRYEVTIGK